MKKYFLVVFAVASFCVSGELIAEVPATVKADRPVFVEARPDFTRGWLVVQKSAYWPLAYEALDRLEQVRSLADRSDRKELASAMEKSAAWLDLAGSAAVVNPEARIYLISEKMEELAGEIRLSEAADVSAQQIQDLVTAGELAMARSHLLRAIHDTDNAVVPKKEEVVKRATKVLQDADKEIREERVKAAVEQLRYDTDQSHRHLSVAQVYLREAAAAAKLNLGDLADLAIEPLGGKEEPWEITAKDKEVRETASELLDVIDEQRKLLAVKLKGVL